MSTVSKPSVFMVMPFSEDYLALFEELKQRFAERYVFTNAGDMDNQQNILRDIIEGLVNADVVIADVTGLNSNVFYELGLAHAMNKKVIIITQDIGELPFDIKAYRAHEYSMQFNKITKLYEEIGKCLDGAISGEMKYGNPVSDFSPDMIVRQAGMHKTSEATEEMNKQEDDPLEPDDISDMGFLDYLADFDESTTDMTTSINSLGEDLEELNTAVTGSLNTLNRAKSSSKTLDPSFVRNVARKLSGPVKEFADKMNTHVTYISEKWDRAENCYLAMLEDKHSLTSQNIENVKGGITSLVDLRQAIDISNGQVEGFGISLRSCLGLERQLTKALNATIGEVEQYLSMTDSMKSSIDRMISKSRATIDLWESES